MDKRNARPSLSKEDEYERLDRYEKLASLFRENTEEEDSEDYWSEPEELEE